MCQRKMAIIKLHDGTVLLAKNIKVTPKMLKLKSIRYSHPDEEHHQSCDSMRVHKDAVEVFFVLHTGEKE